MRNKLSESSLNRVRKRGEEEGFIIISSNRGNFDEDDKYTKLVDEYNDYLKNNEAEDTEENKSKFLAERNKKADRELLHELRKLDNPFTYLPVFGGYHDDVEKDSLEPSYIVFNSQNKHRTEKASWDKLYKKAIEWCKKYYQMSVLIKPPHEEPYYMDCDENIIGMSTGEPTKYNRREEMYYTTINRKMGNNKKIRVTYYNRDLHKEMESTLGEALKAINDMYYMYYLKKINDLEVKSFDELPSYAKDLEPKDFKVTEVESKQLVPLVLESSKDEDFNEIGLKKITVNRITPRFSYDISFYESYYLRQLPGSLNERMALEGMGQIVDLARL